MNRWCDRFKKGQGPQSSHSVIEALNNAQHCVQLCRRLPLNLGLSWKGRRLRLLLWWLLLLRFLSGCWSQGGFNNSAAKAGCNHGDAHLNRSRRVDRYARLRTKVFTVTQCTHTWMHMSRTCVNCCLSACAQSAWIVSIFKRQCALLCNSSCP